MEPFVQRIATDFIAYARYDAGEAPEQVGADAMAMFELPQEKPELVWEVIRYIMGQYSDDDLFSSDDSEAKKVIGLVAAGPLEDLLGYHGPNFIERVEEEARGDRRMAWALGGMYQFLMSDEIWSRTRLLAVDWAADRN